MAAHQERAAPAREANLATLSNEQKAIIGSLPIHPLPPIFRNAEVADLYVNQSSSTAEIAANSPRYRRRSSTFIDGIHDLPDEKSPMAPAQLYSTMSGRLFHSGRIAIVLVGPPARGKT